MALIVNGANGGTSGVTVTGGPGNSGGASGTAFDAVVIGDATATLTFDNAHSAHGTLGYKFQLGSVVTEDYVQWLASFSAVDVTPVYLRAYCYFTANPGATIYVARVAQAAGTSVAGISLDTAGKLLAKDGAGTIQATSAAAIPLNQWFRWEAKVIGSATVGQITILRFDTADAVQPSETLATAATLNTAGAMSRIRFGHTGTGQATIGPWWMDDLGASTVDYIGPVGAGYRPPPIFAPLKRPARLRFVKPAQGDATGGAIQINASDTGVGADTATLATALSAADLGTGADTATLAAALTAADTGTGADVAVSVGLTGTDTGSGVDTATLAAALTGTDTATGADTGTLAADLAAADTATGVDNATVTVIPDALPAVQRRPPPMVRGPGFLRFAPRPAQGVSSDAIQISAADTGTSSDTATLATSLTATDTGTGADIATPATALTAADTGSSTSDATLVAALTGADTATAADLAALATSIAAADLATAIDTASVVIVGAPVGGSATGYRPGVVSATGYRFPAPEIAPYGVLAALMAASSVTAPQASRTPVAAPSMAGV